jgi:hypothetical protein
MGAVFALSVNYVDMNCGVEGCGIRFALTESHYNKVRQTGAYFYCPNGHNICFMDSENEKLKRELEAEKSNLDWVRKQRDKFERQRNAFKGVVTKVKNRVGNGVCPCCTRTFQNLKRHMSHMHPDFKKEATDGKI